MRITVYLFLLTIILACSRKPKYELGECYINSEENILKIVGISSNQYRVRTYYEKSGWISLEQGVEMPIEGIEQNYTTKIICPK